VQAIHGAIRELDQESGAELGADLYALIVFLHKNCNSDLFRTVGELELTLTQTKLLQHLEDADRELTLKEITELVAVSLPAVSRTVDDLFRRGYVLRHEDTEDRRMKRVSLTDTGRAVILRLNAARLQGLEQFTRSLDDSERAALGNALAKLLAHERIAACRPTGVKP
jgi:DNA-binding MarR family transcriptional regulator